MEFKILYTTDSFNYVEGDTVKAAVIFGGIVHSFIGVLGKAKVAPIPFDKVLIHTNINRNYFINDDKLPEELQKYCVTDENQYNNLNETNCRMYQVVGFDVTIHKKSHLPFDRLNVPLEYLSPLNKDEGKIYIPIGLIINRVRLAADFCMYNEIIETNIGQKCKVKTKVYLEGGGRKICEYQGNIVGFEFSKCGILHHILKVNKSSINNNKFLNKNEPRYFVLFQAYPEAEFILITGDYIVEYVPLKLGTYKQEYLNALKKFIPKDLVKGTIKVIKIPDQNQNEQEFNYAEDFWYAFTNNKQHISSTTSTISLEMEFAGNAFLKLRSGSRTAISPKVGDVIFGFPIKGHDKTIKSLAWFYSKQYPGFEAFYDFIQSNGEKGQISSISLNNFKHRNEHTVFSMLMAGYFNPKANFPIITWFKQRHLWYL